MALTHKYDPQVADTNKKIRKALRADIEMTIGLGQDLLDAGIVTTAQLSANTKARYQELKTMLEGLGT